MALALAGAVVEVDDIFVPPVGGMAVGDDNIGGLPGLTGQDRR